MSNILNEAFHYDEVVKRSVNNKELGIFEMSIESYLNFTPTVSESSFIASSADVIGRVWIGDESSVWYNATLRGDINEIHIGAKSNVQDNVVIHNSDDYPTVVGELVTVGHSAILHACEIKNEVLVGMGATLLDGSVIGEQSIIGANALITGETVIPPGSLVLGSPAKVVRALSMKERQEVKKWALKYVKQSRIYMQCDFNQK